MQIENCKFKIEGPVADKRDGNLSGSRSCKTHIVRLLQLAICILQFSICIAPTPAIASPKKDFDREIARQKKELEDLRDRLQAEQRELAHCGRSGNPPWAPWRRSPGTSGIPKPICPSWTRPKRPSNKSLGSVRREMGGIEERIQERNAVMARRVRTLFMTGGPDRMVLMGWESGHGDFMRKVFFMKRVLRYDRALVEAGSEDAALKRRAADKLNARIAELDGFRAHKAKEKETYARARKTQEKHLAEIQSDEAAKQEALKEMEENAKLITEIIAALEKRRKEELARNKKATVLETGSKYCLPVEGEVISKYGLQYHSTLKTTTKNLGIEIRGAAGTPGTRGRERRGRAHHPHSRIRHGRDPGQRIGHLHHLRQPGRHQGAPGGQGQDLPGTGDRLGGGRAGVFRSPQGHQNPGSLRLAQIRREVNAVPGPRRK